MADRTVSSNGEIVESSSTGAARLITRLKPYRDDAWDIDVLRRTKMCLLDNLACYSAGLSLPHFAQSAAAARRSFLGNNPVTEPSPFAMAYIYGQAANALDYDDTLYGHPGSPIVGTLLVVAIENGLTLDRLLRGIAAAYEAHWILSAAALPSPGRASQVRSIGAFDTVAASIGAFIAMDLDDVMIERVIGVALTHSILPYVAKWYERPVPAMKNNMGWVAAGAILSVSLAALGQTGVTRALDGDTGMWRMVGSDRWVLEDDLVNGKPAVLRTGFKYFPACWLIQEYLKTFSALLAQVPTDDEVLDIVVAGPADIEKFCHGNLGGAADIAFSLPALFARLISGIEPGPRWDDIEITERRPNFSYERSDPRSIKIRTRGRLDIRASVELSGRSDLAENGLDENGVIAKFKRLADPVLQAEVLPFLETDDASTTDVVPRRLYRAVVQSVTRVLNS